ncbi:hypothetical protein MXL82_02300 [Staphylococcus gallinarum]|uniref:hypothetical protein n=1 Tax=Staphylococcus gallinarum TaxID=1293 RepID=UPI002DBB67E2|nr:hypothetical protein [Staphylococcus gallinarum]MEB6241874.1 hypothetical protein [Staphylococcus gallinarum]MEB6295051.1 hypothetical protein [Staphylococcus gallinarum]
MTTYRVTKKQMAKALGYILTTVFAQYIKQCKRDDLLYTEFHNEFSETQNRLYVLINQNKIDACIKAIPHFLIPYLKQSVKEVERFVKDDIKPSFYEIDNKLNVLI